MAVSRKAFVLLLVAGILQTEMASSARSQDRRKENARLSDIELLRPRKVEEDSNLENICDIQAPISIYCYCDSLSLSDATAATCYVFNRTDSTSPWLHFRSQPNITELTLNLRPQGTLASIPQTALKALHILKKFKITGAEIKNIESDSFPPSLEALTELDLADNQIETIQRDSFATISNLKSLFLNDNSLKVLQKGQFSQLLNLEMLLLNSNMISQLEDGVFTDLENLVELNLEKNVITALTTRTFEGLSNLQTLLLQKNSLQIIADDTFVHVPKLRRLNLRSNQIEVLGNRAFYGLSELQDLNLQENQVHQIGESTWRGLSALFYLNLRDNKMSILNETAFSPIWENLLNESMSFFVEGNPMECSCQVKWLKVLRSSSQSMPLQASLDSLHCEKQLQGLVDYLEANCSDNSTTTEVQPTTILTTTILTTSPISTTINTSTASTTTTEETLTSSVSSSTATQSATSGSTPAEATAVPANPLPATQVPEDANITATNLHSANRDSKNLRTDSKYHDDFLQKDAVVVLPEPTAVTDKRSNQVTADRIAQNSSSAADTFRTNVTCVRLLLLFSVLLML